MKLKFFRLRRSRIIAIIGVIIIASIIFVVGLNFLPTEDYTISDKTKAVIQPAIEKQQKIEDDMEAYYRSGTYTFTNPLVVQNPYGATPLTALVIFDTPDAMQISIHVPGKTPQASVDFTFEGFNKHHEVPVYGLYADFTNDVRLKEKNQAGEITETIVEMKTEPLPVYLDKVKIVQANPDLYNPGMNFTFQDYKFVFDINGDIRWFSSLSTFQTFAPLANGHYLFTYLVHDAPNDVVMEQDLLGKIYAVYNVPNGVHHDFAELPNGNLLMTSEGADTKMINDFIVEFDRSNGHIVRSFDLKDYLDKNRPNEILSVPEDWLHMNSIVYDSSDQSIIFSSRGQSAVVKMSYPEMKIQWILGPHDNWGKVLQPYLLTPTGENFEWQWSQHAATVLSDTTVNGHKTTNILLFDNGNFRSFEKEKALSAVNSYSRIVQYQIDETNRTVEQIWEYGKERGSEIFSTSRGSAYRLGNGDFIGNWAEIRKDKNGLATMSQDDSGSVYSKIIEMNPANKQVVFEANINDVNYRAFRASLYDRCENKDSIVAIKVNNTTILDPGEQAVTILQNVKKNLDRSELWLYGASLKMMKWVKN